MGQIEEMKEVEYILYPQRWWMLCAFSILSCSSAWIWITWSPIAIFLKDMWDVPLSAVDDLSGVYMYVYVPCSFISLYLVVNHVGLRNGLIIGGICNCVGAYFRYAYFESYHLVYAGTLLCAIAQTFTLSTPPLIAGSWFGANERATSTSLGILANQFGTALGLGATIFFDFFDSASGDLDNAQVHKYLRLQFYVTCLALALVLFFAGDNPPTPPSRAAFLARYDEYTLDASESDAESDLIRADTCSEETPLLTTKNSKLSSDALPQNPTYFESISLMIRDFHSMMFALCFGLAIGVYYTLPALLSQLLPKSCPPRSIGWLGASYQLIGVFGSFGAGRIIDATGNHRQIAISCLAMSFVFLLVFSLTALGLFQSNYLPWLVPILIGCTGTSLSAFNTVGVELGTSMLFPADEAAVTGVLESAAELGGFLWVTLGGAMSGRAGAAGQITLLLAACTGVSMMVLYFIKTEQKRPL